MNARKTLLEKYSIPIEHLDFEYTKTCENVRVLEKIIEILKSGEEGYYPDLTKFAEAKLNEVDPDNRVLRTEVKCRNTGMDERQEINEFIKTIKAKDQQMRNEINVKDESDDSFPPVRTATSSAEAVDAIEDLKSIDNKSRRIASSDYKQWDKYDADTECLKIDLHEEKVRELSLIEQKRQQRPKLIEVLSEETTNISDVEKHEFAERHRIKGNEFFKCSDYQQAVSEYTRSLSYARTAAVYNNRAVAYLKQKMYSEAIRDCDKCLKLEPNNVKAMLRKCDALIATNCKNEAYKLYSEIQKIDSENVIAKKALKNMSIRLEIQDVNNQSRKDQILYLKPTDDDDCRDIIIPK